MSIKQTAFKKTKKIDAQQAYFIKLGREGKWESECLEKGILRLGYRETPHELCLKGDWEGVQQFWKNLRNDAGTASRHTNQIRAFYEADENVIFITFAHDAMYWCRPCGEVQLLSDKGKQRGTLEGWSNKNINGKLLTKENLSGHLIKVQGFRGTICQVKAFDYLVRKLNDELLPEVEKADEAERSLLEAIIGLVRRLTWQDFETLVDLIFSSSGWRRVSRVGGTQKTVDFELILPSTDERAFVQVKSQASDSDFRKYTKNFENAANYKKMFFVWHTGDLITDDEENGVIAVGPQRLARMVLDSGLWSWLREKVS